MAYGVARGDLSVVVFWMWMSARLALMLCLVLCACTGGRRGVLEDAASSQGSDRSDRRAPSVRTAEVRSWYLRAAVAENRGDLDEAESALIWVRRFEDPSSPWPDVARGRLYERGGRHEDAIGAFQDAIIRDQSCAQAHLGMGRVMVRRKLDAGARLHLERAVELQPGPDSLELLGRLYMRAREPELALAVLEQWLQLTTSRAEAVRQLRLARYIGCDAIGHIEGVVAAWKTSPEILREGAAAYDGCGMSDQAQTLRQSTPYFEASP